MALKCIIKHKAVVASLNSGVNTLTGEGLAEVSTN
jgi:hypothetical protein